jgi:nicotinamide mononucleotide adenylyltransferase
MAVTVSTTNGFTAGTAQQLFQTRLSTQIARAHVRPTPDGQRFLVLAALGRETVQPTSVILNWAAGLKK